MGLLVHAVAGRPVQGSLSPLLALLTVGRLEEAGVVGLGLATTRAIRIDAKSTEEALARFHASAMSSSTGLLHHVVAAHLHDEPRPSMTHPPVFQAGGGQWLSLTSPLKHQVGAWRCIDRSHALLSVNALRVDGEDVRSAGTDGAGVVDVARMAGVSPEKGAVLRLRGGGGAARSTAHAWAEAGGRLHLVEGRRVMKPQLHASSLVGDDAQAALGIDFDGEGVDLGAALQVVPAYQGTRSPLGTAVQGGVLDGRWMLVAQHLAAWRSLWAPELSDALPTLEDLMHDLLSVEVALKAA